MKTKFHEGFLIGRLLSRRGRRSADERFNIDGEIEADLVSQLASDEVRQIILLILIRFAYCYNLNSHNKLV